MAELRSVLTKRKIDQFEIDDHIPFNKKIKIDHSYQDEEIHLFSSFPPEVHGHVLSYITNDDHRRHIRLVCRTWFDLINYNEFKIGLLLASEADEFYHCFSRYEKPIGLKFMKLDYLNSPRAVWPNEKLMTAKQIRRTIKNLTHLTALDLQLNYIEVPKQLINLRELTTLHHIRESLLPNLSNLTRLKIPNLFRSDQLEKMLSNLQSLEFNGFSFKSLCMGTNTTLTQLKISTPDFHFFSTLRNLRKLEIWNQDVDFRGISDTQSFPDLEELMAWGKVSDLHFWPENLTTLGTKSIELNENFTQLKELVTFWIQNFNTSHIHNSLKSLESCVVTDPSVNGKLIPYLDWNKITRLKTTATEENYYFFAKCTNLVDLDLSLAPNLPQNEPYSAPLTNLTRLIMSYKSYPMDWMTGLPNLVELFITKTSDYLADPMPETIDFQGLNHLTSLQLKGKYNCINLWNLTNLVQLDIEDKMRSHSLKIHGLSTVQNLTRLVFHLSPPRRYRYKALKNWYDLMSLTKLRELCIHKENNNGDVTKLTTLQNLTYLDIYVNNSLVNCLTKLTRLQKVVIETEVPIDNELFLKALPFCHSFDVSINHSGIK